MPNPYVFTDISGRVANVSSNAATDANALGENGKYNKYEIENAPTMIFHSVSSADYVIPNSPKELFLSITTGVSDRTATLPAAASNTNRIIRIVKSDTGSGKVIIDGNGSETINGGLTFDIHEQYCGVVLYCDGAGWIIIAAIGNCAAEKIGANWKLVYKTSWSGTLDSATTTTIPHGLAGTLYPKRLLCTADNTTAGGYFTFADTVEYYVRYDSTNIIINVNDSNFYGEEYTVEMEYYR